MIYDTNLMQSFGIGHQHNNLCACNIERDCFIWLEPKHKILDIKETTFATLDAMNLRLLHISSLSLTSGLGNLISFICLHHDLLLFGSTLR